MKYFRLFSDLHNEMRGNKPFDIPAMDTDNETVLILAGDIHVKDGIFKNDWIQNLAKRFGLIVYILGNHEHWRSSIGVTEEKILDGIHNHGIKNLYLCENNYFFLHGTNWAFYGGTMWTDYNKGDPITMWNAEQVMNDFRYIRTKNYSRRLTPSFLGTKHVNYKMSLESLVMQHPDTNFVVVSHHAPHQLSIADAYIDQYHDNGCYASDLSNLILDHQNIRYWLHGHVHQPKNYMIGDCEIISNPVGYPDQDTGYNPFLIKELK